MAMIAGAPLQLPESRERGAARREIVDQILSDETPLMGLTTLRDFDEYTFTHSVNVCIFSVALGKKLGFTLMELLVVMLILAVLMAIVSSLKNKPLPEKMVVFGEVGLAGEVRQLQGQGDRVRGARSTRRRQ